MPIYTYSSQKNLKLIEERGVSFEEVVVAIQDNQVVDILDHPNLSKYGSQRIYVIIMKGYVYLVPFVTDVDGNIFLKTIIPSRKAKKQYLGDEV